MIGYVDTFNTNRVLDTNTALLAKATRSEYRSAAVYCLDRDRRIVRFPEWSSVPEQMETLLAFWNREWPAAAGSLPPMAKVLARFWHSFLCIHPFADANRRTAETLIVAELNNVGFGFAGFALVRRVLFAGDRDVEIAHLEVAFLLSIHRHRGGSP